MDRFIGSTQFRKYHRRTNLKSNMDRFIAFTNPRTKMITEFKIQYGQIYSTTAILNDFSANGI